MSTSSHAAETDVGAAQRWADQLASWAIPEEILAAAPDSPYGFDAGLFARIADESVDDDTPSTRAAREQVPVGGSVLDVGCGGGKGALPLAPPAGRLIGVDEMPDMLAAFTERAAARDVASETVVGRWPDVADAVPAADVVVCHNVLYNVADIEPFVRALADHAHARVVVEITEHHPLAWTNPYWRELHDIERPSGPSAADAAAAIRELGFDVVVERWERPWGSRRTLDEQVAFVRKRLCVGPERDPDVRALLQRQPPPASRPVATLWWDA